MITNNIATLRVLLLLLATTCHAGAEDRYFNEVASFQSIRTPQSPSFSMQRSEVGVLRPTPVITTIVHSIQDTLSEEESDQPEAEITKRNSSKDSPTASISQSDGHHVKEEVNNSLDDNTRQVKLHRRRRRKKRPGVFLLPTSLYPGGAAGGGGSSSSFSRVRGRSNFASSSTVSRSHSSSSVSSTQQSSSTSFSASSIEAGLSSSSTSERLNRTFAAALMKQQYHRFRALLPGGQDDANWGDEEGDEANSNKGKSVLGRITAQPSTQHISRTSLSRTAAVGIAENFKQQRSAGESTGTLRSGKLQPFLPSDLLIPTGRGAFADQSPEQLDSNNTGSVDSITRLLDERLGPGASTNYDPSILVDFLALIALTKPQQQTARSGVRGEQIAGVLTPGRRRGGDIAGRLSQRRVNLLPITPLRHNLPPPLQHTTANEDTPGHQHTKDNSRTGSRTSGSILPTTTKEPLASNGGGGDEARRLQLEVNQADLPRLTEPAGGTEEVTTPQRPHTINRGDPRHRLQVDPASKGDKDQALTNQELLTENTLAEAATKTFEEGGDPEEVIESESSADVGTVSADNGNGKTIIGTGITALDHSASGFEATFTPLESSEHGVSNTTRDGKTHPSAEVIPQQLGRATSRLEAPLLFSDLEEILQRNEVPASPPEGGSSVNEGGPVQARTVQPTQHEAGGGEMRSHQQQSEFGPHSDGNDPDAGLPPPALPPVLRASLYSYLVPRLMALAPLTETIPGVPGLDYPIMNTLPYTNFYCTNMPWPGFYADTEARCQAWHLCDLDGRQASFLCPNGTIFNQAFMVCDWWYNSDCQAAPYLYPLNERLFQQPELPPPTQQHRTLTAQVLDTLFL